jgi:hypothetical protein
VLLKRAEYVRTPLDRAEPRGHCCTLLLYLFISRRAIAPKFNPFGVMPVRNAVVLAGSRPVDDITDVWAPKVWAFTQVEWHRSGA